MDRDTALTKIKKCLALGKSAEPHEAAAALRQAQKLMLQFSITDGDLDLASVLEAHSQVPAGALSAWQANLGRFIAEAFGCEHLWSNHRLLIAGQGLRNTRSVIFIGVGPAAEVAQYTFDVLLRQCIKARTAHVARQPKTCKPITKTARGDRFAMGWVLGIHLLVQRFAGNAQQELLLAYMDSKFDTKRIKPSRKDVGRNVRDADYLGGVDAGRRADLRRGVGGQQQQQRIEQCAP